MANTDIRVGLTFPQNPMLKRLMRLIGPGAAYHLISLWVAVAASKPDGILENWDENSIADAANWMGNPKKLVEALEQCDWLHRTETGYRLHDTWTTEQLWAANADVRAESARKAALTKWGKTDAPRNAPRNASGNASGNAPRNASGNASGNAPRNAESCATQCVRQCATQCVGQCATQCPVPTVPTLPTVITKTKVETLNKSSESSSSSPKPPSSEPRKDREEEDDSSFLVSEETRSLYEKCFGQKPPALIEAELAKAEAIYPKDWIKNAFRRASLYNGKSWKYVLSILEEWAAEKHQAPTPARQTLVDQQNRALQGDLSTQEWLDEALRGIALKAGHRPREDQIKRLSENPFGKAALKEIQEYDT